MILLLFAGLLAQTAFEAGDRVVYVDRAGVRRDLGVGFSPVVTRSGSVTFLRGSQFGYGEPFDCGNSSMKNWVALYDPATGRETVLFDRTLLFEREGIAFCVFDQVGMSPDGALLYLVSRVYATSGSLAIVTLPSGTVCYVPGVNFVYVIERGPHRGELIYQLRVLDAAGVDYRLVHARADGEKIVEISNENLARDGSERPPILSKYLRRIGGTIKVGGRVLP